jgi:probable rRNA maturation factor
MQLIISNQTKTRIPRKSLEIVFSKTLKTLKKDKQGGIIELTFVSKNAIQKLNKTHRKKDAPTDVLSFAYSSEKSFKNDLAGEIAIAPDIAIKQKKASESLKKELNKLFIHGLLHIFGYNHKTDEDFYTMNKIEKRILQAK